MIPCLVPTRLCPAAVSWVLGLVLCRKDSPGQSRDELGLDIGLRRISIASALFVELHTTSSLCTLQASQHSSLRRTYELLSLLHQRTENLDIRLSVHF
jgi:hypothetical protein